MRISPDESDLWNFASPWRIADKRQLHAARLFSTHQPESQGGRRQIVDMQDRGRFLFPKESVSAHSIEPA
jgi:hypothetical protein